MGALQIIGIAVVVAIAALLVLAATRPGRFRIERSGVVEVPPERVFPHVNDFRAWREWSPWEGLDPDLKRSYSGASAGVGAVYAWEGNRDAGAGRMEIAESVAPSRIAIRLDFLKPVAARNLAEFSFAPEGAATRVTWAMSGPSPFMARAMGLFMNFDRMIGAQFEQGLVNLKAVAEK